MNNSVDVSVIICAYTEKRWDDLVAAVRSVQQQKILPREIIVVIDHNPTLLAHARAHLSDVVVVENVGQRGLSGARNSGIAATQGEIIAFLDDDAIASPEWLSWLYDWFKNAQVMGTGGVVQPVWESHRPAWFPDEFDWVIGCSYRGLPQQTAEVRNLFGGCMCIRREVFAAIGGFRSGIGRDKARPMGCEETELCIRAKQHWPERSFFFEPRAWAYHRVPAQRGTWQYFQSRCYAEGLSKALVTRFVGVRDGLAAERTYVLRTLPVGVIRGLKETLVQGDVTGLARAGAIILGFIFAVAGYCTGVVTQHFAQYKVLILGMALIQRGKRLP